MPVLELEKGPPVGIVLWLIVEKADPKNIHKSKAHTAAEAFRAANIVGLTFSSVWVFQATDAAKRLLVIAEEMGVSKMELADAWLTRLKGDQPWKTKRSSKQSNGAKRNGAGSL